MPTLRYILVFAIAVLSNKPQGDEKRFKENSMAFLVLTWLSKRLTTNMTGMNDLTLKEKIMGMIFCRGCGKEIHESAPTCPHCGAPQGNPSNQGKSSFSSYDQVPWYRKNWCAIICFLIFSPGLLVILLTGDVYYESKGQIKTYSKGAKIFLIIWSIGYFLAALARMKH